MSDEKPNPNFKSDLLLRRTIPTNGIAKNAPRRFTMKRAAPPSPYMPYEKRCQFAIETKRSLDAPEREQVIELELMYNDERL